jgi:hypothetical protein
MKKMKQIRQGDVLLRRVSQIPPNATPEPPQRGKIVLALGEVTGHSHTIDADAADWWKDGEEQYVHVTQPTEVRHQEHGPLGLAPGERFIKIQQREYTPESIRNVAD